MPASSEWRQHLNARGRQREVQGLSVDPFPFDQVEFQFYNVGSFGVHDTLPFACFGNTSSKRDTGLVFKIAKVPSSRSDGPDFEMVRIFQQPDTFGDLSWVADRLLCASLDGAVYFYRLDDLRDADQQGTAITHKFVHRQVIDAPIFPPTPGSMLFSSRVNRVVLNANTQTDMLTTENLNMHLWDLDHDISDPWFSLAPSKLPTMAADWSPHSPDKFVLGGFDQTLRLFDQRLLDNGSENPVWIQRGAHQAPIRDVKWSPHVPHWIVSAGDDSSINLWDLRFAAGPAMSLVDHIGGVSSLSWSPGHAEILLSGGSDRSVKLWSLTLPPHHVLYSHKAFSSSVCGVAFSGEDACKAYGVSDKAEFCCITLTDSFSRDLVQSRFSREDVVDRDVEKALYIRNFRKAFERALALAEKYAGEGTLPRLRRAIALLEMCYERACPPVDPEELELPDDADSALMFATDLSNFSYYIPPNFPDKFTNQPDAATLFRIQQLKLRLELKLHTVEANVTKLLDLSDVVVEQASRADQVAPPVPLSQIAEVARCLAKLCPFDKVADFGLKLAHLWGTNPEERSQDDSASAAKTHQRRRKPATRGPSLAKDFMGSSPRWREFIPVARAILSPLIYDPITTNGQDAVAMELSLDLGLIESVAAPATAAGGAPIGATEDWVNRIFTEEDVVQQLNFLKVFARLQAAGDESALIEFGLLRKPALLVTARFNLDLLELLLAHQRFDSFYVLLTDLLQECEGYDFYETLYSLLKKAFPLFQTWLDDTMSIVSKSATGIGNYQRAAGIILRTLESCKQVPKSLLSLLPDYLALLCERLEHSLRDLATHPDPDLDMPPEQQASALARPFLDEMERSLGTNGDSRRAPYEASLRSLLGILHSYAGSTALHQRAHSSKRTNPT